MTPIGWYCFHAFLWASVPGDTGWGRSAAAPCLAYQSIVSQTAISSVVTASAGCLPVSPQMMPTNCSARSSRRLRTSSRYLVRSL